MKRVLRSEKRTDEEEEDDGNNYEKGLVVFFFSLDELVSIMLSYIDSDIDLFKLQCVSSQFNRLLKPLVIKNIPTILVNDQMKGKIQQKKIDLFRSVLHTRVLKKIDAFIGNPYRLRRRICLIEVIFNNKDFIFCISKENRIFDILTSYVTYQDRPHSYCCKRFIDERGWLNGLHRNLRDNINKKPIIHTIVIRLYNWTHADETDREILFSFIQTGVLNMNNLTRPIILPAKTNLVIITGDIVVNEAYNGPSLRWHYHSDTVTERQGSDPTTTDVTSIVSL